MKCSSGIDDTNTITPYYSFIYVLKPAFFFKGIENWNRVLRVLQTVELLQILKKRLYCTAINL